MTFAQAMRWFNDSRTDRLHRAAVGIKFAGLLREHGAMIAMQGEDVRRVAVTVAFVNACEEIETAVAA